MFLKSPTTLTAPRFDLDYAIRSHVRNRDAVLVALDGAGAAERAIPRAAKLAKHWDAPLHLVHIRNPVDDAHEIDLHLIDNSASLSVQTRSGAYLRDMAETLRSSSGLSVTWETATGTSIDNTLRSLCERKTRALVMVRSRRSSLSRFWSGSVTDSLIGRLAVPLLVIPETENAVDRATPADANAFERMLAYVDGTEASDDVIDGAISVAPSGAVCHLLRVLPLAALYTAGRGGYQPAFTLRNEAWRELFRAKEKLEQNGIDCRSRLILDGQSAGAVVIAQARARQAQMIVVAARQHLLPWWLRNGVAEYVVRHANIPVMIVPAAGNVVSQTGSSHVDIHFN